jgi:hypothetical protein
MVAVSPQRRIIVPVPVIAQPVLDLEILPRKAQGHGGEAGDAHHIAERVVFRGPGNRRPAACGHGDRAIEMVGVDVGEVRAFLNGQRRVAELGLQARPAKPRAKGGDRQDKTAQTHRRLNPAINAELSGDYCFCKLQINPIV